MKYSIKKSVSSNIALDAGRAGAPRRKGFVLAEVLTALAILALISSSVLVVISRCVKAAADTKAENVFLDLLAHYEREGRNVSPNPSNSYAPSVFAKDDRRDGLSKTVLEGAMNRLFSAGTIRAEDFGRPSRPAKRIVMA